jgi:hypothetical protein
MIRISLGVPPTLSFEKVNDISRYGTMKYHICDDISLREGHTHLHCLRYNIAKLQLGLARGLLRDLI